MSQVHAIIENNRITNIMKCDQGFADSIRENFQAIIRIDEMSPTPMIGWSYDELTETLSAVPVDIADHKAKKIETVINETRAYITSRYAVEKQMSLLAVFIQALAQQKINRLAYISLALSWVDSVLTYHYVIMAAINAASTNEEIDAVAYGFSQFNDTDPMVTIYHAREIPN